ncbi:FMN-binding protein [Streptomyces olivaceus]|uniref:FMN-binding protein n=1 Tax=Streptomyces olivaceus TaxID=47716 RepID=UPI004057AB84
MSKKIATALVGMSVTGVMAACSATDADSGTSGPRSPSNTNTNPSPSSSSANGGPYKDGEYEVNGEYGTRGSSIGVALTLEDDNITAVDVTPHATDETSLGLQRRFATAVPALVVGKDIDDVDLDRVAGNSHTPDGFNDAIAKIKEEAAR